MGGGGKASDSNYLAAALNICILVQTGDVSPSFHWWVFQLTLTQLVEKQLDLFKTNLTSRNEKGPLSKWIELPTFQVNVFLRQGLPNVSSEVRDQVSDCKAGGGPWQQNSDCAAASTKKLQRNIVKQLGECTECMHRGWKKWHEDYLCWPCFGLRQRAVVFWTASLYDSIVLFQNEQKCKQRKELKKESC